MLVMRSRRGLVFTSEIIRTQRSHFLFLSVLIVLGLSENRCLSLILENLILLLLKLLHINLSRLGISRLLITVNFVRFLSQVIEATIELEIYSLWRGHANIQTFHSVQRNFIQVLLK